MSQQDNTMKSGDGDALLRLKELVSDIRVSMVTTEGAEGMPHCRPMYAQHAESDGDLWFATSKASSLTQEVREGSRVLATFSDPGSQKYVVVYGTGFVRHDPAMVAELWNAGMKAWFPAGPTDPDITLIRVEAERAEYWDTPSAPVRLLQFVTALATRSRPKGGSHETLDLRDPTRNDA